MLEQDQTKTMKLVKSLEKNSYKEQPRVLWLFSVKKRRLWGDLITLFNYQKGGCREVGIGLFLKVRTDKTRGNYIKLYQERFRLNIRRDFYTKGIISGKNRLPSEVFKSSSLDVFKIYADMVLKYMVQ